MAPVNIAVIKYWGKRDTVRILPTNSSLSVTLDTADLRTTTTIRAHRPVDREGEGEGAVGHHHQEGDDDREEDAAYEAGRDDRDRMWLNGREEDLAKNPRVRTCLAELRQRRQRWEEDLVARGAFADADAAATTAATVDATTPSPSPSPTTPWIRGLYRWPVHIITVNNFPTAAGLASSASGLACLAYTLAELYGLIPGDGAEGDNNNKVDKEVVNNNKVDKESTGDNDNHVDRRALALTEVSKVARMGSGSACRSLFGGYVKWVMGERMDGEDSVAVPVAARSHWPQMRALILVVSDARKDVSSTQGMQTTVQTSPLFQHRVHCGGGGLGLVDERICAMERAIHHRDFPAFAELTMKDSNQFHAVCLDTYPPITYLNDTSRKVGCCGGGCHCCCIAHHLPNRHHDSLPPSLHPPAHLPTPSPGR